MPKRTDNFSSEDRARIEAQGLTLEEVERQAALLRHPPPAAVLLRPCTAGDGVTRIDEGDHAALLALASEAARAGRLSKFVPASGAASRMFEFLRSSDPGHPDVRRFRENASSFAFEAGDLQALAALPKGLLPFHRYAGTVRTPFEEHLVEAAATVRDAAGVCRIHVTVSPEHRSAFDVVLEQARPRLERETGTRFEVRFSEQSPSTDTVAIDERGRLFRDSEGRLLFRPGGHGALLKNLAESGGDVVLVKNIDNVVPDDLRAPTLLWKRLLSGLLVRIERTIPRDRPLRACGVVRNEGEPGGGPFWVEGPGGETPQIVESAQVDLTNPEQAAIWNAATHFNPVDLACSLRDASGRPFDLRRFVDERAVFIAKKTHGGRTLFALERPGLWNGAMALWETTFVEVPIETFTPVKTALDLLRPEHQPRR
ncbi:MAG TPA: DUF4301 family protein [Thermoanaerobaculia bacterium]|nr:DUF4301 family protein [Thermoanaerobaculia bacterium]